MSRNRKFLVSAAVVSLTSALALTASPLEAMAAPAKAPTIDQVKADIARVEGESKSIEEDYAGKAAALRSTYAQLNSTKSAVSAQQAKVKQLDAQARAAINGVVATYSTSGANAAVVREYTARLERLGQLNRTAAAQAKAAAAGEATLAGLAAKGDAKAAEGDQLLASLTPENQKVLEGEQATERAQSAATAADQLDALKDAEKTAQQPVQADAIGGSTEATGAQSLSIASSISHPGIRRVVSYAISKVGRSQYVWGAAGPSNFDCSGLMLASYRQIGVSLPHSSRAQATRGRWVSRYGLKAGDLIFYYSPISHVAMYAGSGYIVHARNTRVDIVLQKFNAYPAKFNTARRIVG
ncbi:NlpC/P60 family protein [Nigerium sp.]|uniref:C40 family peptidase n=1 Tax=Nigerium sp. TaxID=2042655 RepID=UPI003221A726